MMKQNRSLFSFIISNTIFDESIINNYTGGVDKWLN